MEKIRLIPCLTPDLILGKDFIFDKSLASRIRINKTTNFILSLVDGNRDSEEIVKIITKKFNIDQNRAHSDFISLLQNLTDFFMINWRYETGNIFWNLYINFIYKFKSYYRERFLIESGNLFSVFLEVSYCFFKKIWIFPFLYLTFALLVSDFIESSLFLPLLIIGIVVFLGFILSHALHEASHLSVYRTLSVDGNPGYLAANNLSMMFVRSLDLSPRQSLLVVLAGPIIPFMAGLFGILMVKFLPIIFGKYLIYFFVTFVIHIVYLFPFWGDGASISKNLKKIKKEGEKCSLKKLAN